MFQLITSLEEFIKTSTPPKWLTDALQEMGWIYMQYPATAGYFNTANEVVETFVIDEVASISVEDLEEVNFTTHPTERILSMLEKAWIVEKHGFHLSPGRLTRRILNIRLSGYEMGSPEIKEKIKEIHGILTLALTRAIFEESKEGRLFFQRGFLPRKIIAVLDLLSEHMLTSGDEIGLEIPDSQVESAFVNLPSRQRNKTQRAMSGFLDGETKVLADVDENGNITLKESMIPYLTEMRERWRSRERELERGT
jgi:hypothetical protein